MDEIRIKDLASASGQLAEFDAFEFIVDVPTAAASMKVSGKEIKGVMAPKKHTHAVSDITGLSGKLDKKLDKKGGTISGDLSVMGDTYLRRLHLEEFLEVPEYRYNRIETVVGDKWSAPGGGIVELVSPENRTLVVKLEEGEISTLRENDLCMGIFLNSAMDASSGNTVDSDDSFGNRTYAGFTTCYFRLTECLDRDTYAEWRYELREGYPYHPQTAMQFVAFGNTADKERRTSRYETRTYLRFLTGMDDWTIRPENIAPQFGDLSNLKPHHGLDMTGYSAYLKNIHLTGFLSDKSGDSWFDSATGNMQLFNRTTGYGVSFRNGILRFGRIDPEKPDAGTDFDELMQTISSTLETLGRINSDEYVSPVEKSFLKERLQDIRTEYEQLRANALRLLSVFRYRSANGKFLMVHGKRRAVRLLADEWMPYEDAYQRAVAAIGKYTQPEPEFIPIEDDFADIEAYYTARRTIGALLDEAAKIDNSDLEYLRENFQDISTEIDAGSGVVLSGFVGVKDDTDKKVVAGRGGLRIERRSGVEARQVDVLRRSGRDRERRDGCHTHLRRRARRNGERHLQRIFESAVQILHGRRYGLQRLDPQIYIEPQLQPDRQRRGFRHLHHLAEPARIGRVYRQRGEPLRLSDTHPFIAQSGTCGGRHAVGHRLYTEERCLWNGLSAGSSHRDLRRAAATVGCAVALFPPPNACGT